MKVCPSVRAFWLYLFVAAGLAALAAGVVLVRSFWFHETYPYNTLLFIPGVRFTDFTDNYERLSHFGTPEFFATGPLPFTYLAASAYAFLFFIKVSSQPFMLYLFLVLVWAAAMTVVNARAMARLLSRRAMFFAVPALMGAMAYPVAVLCDRANLEGILWMILSLGMFSFASRRYGLAAVAFGLGAAMKIYPAIFFLLFLRKKFWRYGALGATSAIVINTIATLGFGIGFRQATMKIAEGLSAYQEIMTYRYRAAEVGFGHAAFSIIQQTMHWGGWERGERPFAQAAQWYAAAAVICFALLYFLRIRKLPVLNQIFALTAAFLVLPFVSADYRLVHLYVPFILLVRYLGEDRTAGFGGLCAILLPLAVLFSPQSWVIFHSVGFGGQIKAMALIALLIASVSVLLPSAMFGERDESSDTSLEPALAVAGDSR